jgi:hypothetical protein
MAKAVFPNERGYTHRLSDNESGAFAIDLQAGSGADAFDNQGYGIVANGDDRRIWVIAGRNELTAEIENWGVAAAS